MAWQRKRKNITVLNDDDFYESTYTRDALCQNVYAAWVLSSKRSSPPVILIPCGVLGGPFRAKGYYQTSALAEALGGLLKLILPWPFNFSTLVIARKP